MALNAEEELELRNLLARFPATRAGDRELVLALHMMALYALFRIEVCAAEGAKAPDPGAVAAIIEWRLIRHFKSVAQLARAEVAALQAVQHFVYAVRAEDHVTRVHNVLDAIDYWQTAAAVDAIEHGNLPVGEDEARRVVVQRATQCLADHAETALVEALRG